jgi:hypothetical protein
MNDLVKKLDDEDVNEDNVAINLEKIKSLKNDFIPLVK